MYRPATNIDYVTTCFKRKKLSKLYDISPYKILKTIKNKLKANARWVQCILGGGEHGNLGLVIADAKYITVTTSD